MKSCLVVFGILLILFALLACAAAVALFVIASRRKRKQQAAVSSVQSNPPSASASAPAFDPAATVAVPLSGSRSAAIVFTSGPLAGRRFEVTPRGFWIGRDAPSEVIIPAASVSRRHTFVGLRDGKAVVLDDGSTNGTFLGTRDGQRITEHFLEHGDVVVVADDAAAFRFESS